MFLFYPYNKLMDEKLIYLVICLSAQNKKTCGTDILLKLLTFGPLCLAFKIVKHLVLSHCDGTSPSNQANLLVILCT